MGLKGERGLMLVQNSLRVLQYNPHSLQVSISFLLLLALGQLMQKNLHWELLVFTDMIIKDLEFNIGRTNCVTFPFQNVATILQCNQYKQYNLITKLLADNKRGLS